MRIAFTTLGCKINQYETDVMRTQALSAGGTIVPFDSEADVYVINTCSVTAKSDAQCRQTIRSAVKKGNGARVLVTGCYARTRPDELLRIPGVQLVPEQDRMRERLAEFLPVIGDEGVRPAAPDPAALRGGRTRGFLKIQDGCDNRCAYCIVPLARGASRSVPFDVVVRQFSELAGAGRPEIVLSGIHIGKYGDDLVPRSDLTTLLTALLAERGNTRIRLSSIEAGEITDEMISLPGTGLCRHLHIPLQSGDDSVLRAMGRNYTANEYLDLLARIAKRVPDIALGADVMVGFPGEGEREFLNTVRLIEESPLTHLHVFSYSPRPDTPAAEMRPQVSEAEKKRRNRLLRELGARKNLAFRKKLLHKELEAVVEAEGDATKGYITALTDNYIRVKVPSARTEQKGDFIRILIKDAFENETIGFVRR